VAGAVAAVGVLGAAALLMQGLTMGSVLVAGAAIAVLAGLARGWRERVWAPITLTLAQASEGMAAQSQAVQDLAQRDVLTGLFARRQLHAELEHAARRSGGLVLLRVADLEGLNRRLGEEAVDRLLAAAAELLASYPRHLEGAVAGRSGGAEFALLLSSPGLAEETAEALLAALQSLWRALASGVHAHAVALEWTSAESPSLVWARAQRAADEAALGEPFGLVSLHGSAGASAHDGETDGEALGIALRQCLQPGRAKLLSFPVCGADGALWHWLSPMTLQMNAESGAPWLKAGKWLPLVARAQMHAAFDVVALNLALQACAHDEQARALHFSPESFADAAFTDEVLQALRAQPRATSCVWLQVSERALRRQPARLHAACRQWRAAGARVCLAHAGGSVASFARWPEIDALSLQPGCVQGIAHDAGLQTLVRSLVALLRWRRIPLIAEGVCDEGDLHALWDAGVQAATGRAITSRWQQHAGAPDAQPMSAV
jgi:EAL domain-containing protein (putative c-di-GMP-specific phosphodiesterase class I)/GGDEF domain-containing protein